MKSILYLMAICFLLVASCGPLTKEKMVLGITLPLTGPMAQLGQSFQKGAMLALKEVNEAGGIHNRPLEIDFQDDQHDAKQAAAAAQKFIANPKVMLAGAVGTVTGMSVRSLYQRGGLAMLGMACSHTSFTETGDFIWSNSLTMEKISQNHAKYVDQLGLKKVALFSINNDFGKPYSALLLEALHQHNIQVAIHDFYLPDEKDFRSLISKAKTQGVQGFLLMSFFPDAVLLIQQIRKEGLQQPIVASGTTAFYRLPQLIGESSEGIRISGFFSANDSQPEVTSFVEKWAGLYPKNEIDYGCAQGYDSIHLAAEILRLSTGTRVSVKDAFTQVKNVPSVVYHGDVSFNPATRYVENDLGVSLVIKEGKIVLWKRSQS